MLKGNTLKLNIFALILAAMLLASPVFATVDPLYIGVGARPLGMGKAYVALAEDGDTIFMNPAGLGRIKTPKLTSMFAELMGDVKYVVLGGVYPGLPVGALGGGAVSTSVSDIRLFDSGGAPLGEADYGNNVYFLSYGLGLDEIFKFGEGVYVGASLKYFSQGGTGDVSLEAGTGTGMDMDLGVLYTPTKWLSLGVNQSNLLGSEVLFEESGIREQIPSITKIGANIAIIGCGGLFYQPAIQGGGYQRLNLAIDYDMSADDPVSGAGHAGLEYYPLQYLALRVGIDQDPGADELVSNMTAGVGLRIDGMEFNYAYHPYDGVIDNTTHFFSISYVGEPEVCGEPEPVAESGVEIIEPEDKTITRDDKIQVVIRVVNYKKGTVLEVNGKEVIPDDDGMFSSAVTIKGYGKKILKVTAKDPDGSVSEDQARLLRLASFKDVKGDYWARPPIEHTGTVGMVEGYPDGSFKPDRALTRAELATLLVRARDIDLPDVIGKPFPDVAKTHWAARYISAAAEMGLVEGYPDGTFRPNNKITRAEGVLVLSRFEGLPEDYVLDEAPYPDIPVTHWAAVLIQSAKDAEFLDYIETETFNPRQQFTRAEAVYILSKTTYAEKKIDWLLDWDKGYDESDVVEDREPELQTFRDVPEAYWASKPVSELATLGIVSGYPDGTFKPSRILSRAELSTLLVKARGLEPDTLYSSSFRDLPRSHWAAGYVKTAVDMGLVQGYPDGTFQPNKKVNRAEAITVIDRFDNIVVPAEIFERPFPDVPVQHWSARFVEGGRDAGILDYLAGKNFEPQRGVTRAEAAEMISKTSFGKSNIETLYSGPTAKYKIKYSYDGVAREDDIVVD